MPWKSSLRNPGGSGNLVLQEIQVGGRVHLARKYVPISVPQSHSFPQALRKLFVSRNK